VNPLPDHRPGQQRAAVRTDARLDAATRQNVDDLATRVDRPRAAVLCQIMAWGLSRAQPAHLDQDEPPGPVRHLYLYVPSELHEHVEKAAEHSHDSRTYTERFMLRLDDLTREKLKNLSTHFDTSAAEMIRQLIAQAKPEDFPPSWQMRATERRTPQARS
jgi:predicted DNA-binding protein